MNHETQLETAEGDLFDVELEAYCEDGDPDNGITLNGWAVLKVARPDGTILDHRFDDSEIERWQAPRLHEIATLIQRAADHLDPVEVADLDHRHERERLMGEDAEGRYEGRWLQRRGWE